MAAAVILIPEMLSGPGDDAQQAAAQRSGDAPVKTYTIDLSRPAASAPVTQEMDTRTPPPEVVPERVAVTPPATQPAEETSPPAATSVPETNVRPAAQPEPRPTAASTPPAVAAVPPKPAPAPTKPALASAPSAPTSAVQKGWAVQVGSFSSRATAERLAKELNAASQSSAFVMPVKSGGNTLYRVRIGPFASRAAADEGLRKIRGKYSNAAVVTHP